MLDVHPPHNPTHTWRDFFIHIATIVIGLIIAVGLAIRRSHPPPASTASASGGCPGRVRGQHCPGRHNLHHIDLDMAWLFELQNRIQTLHTPEGKKSFTYPPPPDGYPGDPHSTDRSLFLEAVWSNARQAAIIDLLPQNDAQLYSRYYSIMDVQLHAFDNLIEDWEKIPAFEFPFRTGSASAPLEVERMSDAQIDQDAAVVAQVYMSAQFNMRLLQVFQAWNAQAVGPRTLPDVAQYLKTHVDPLPPYSPTPAPAL
jgi:hypothetical protein